jgi:protein required for attachment to host cells
VQNLKHCAAQKECGHAANILVSGYRREKGKVHRYGMPSSRRQLADAQLTFDIHRAKNMMEITWILIANGERARCFERHASSHALTELADFVHPHTSLVGLSGGGDMTGAAGKGHGRTGHAGTQFEPRTEARAKEREGFARQLADYLNGAVATRKCSRLVVIASAPMLGELKPCLNHAAQKALASCVTSDLTHYVGADLKERVDHALRLPD